MVFPCSVFTWFWHLSNTSLLESVGNYSFLQFSGMFFGRVTINFFFLKSLVEFPKETIWSWSKFCGNVFHCKLILNEYRAIQVIHLFLNTSGNLFFRNWSISYS